MSVPRSFIDLLFVDYDKATVVFFFFIKALFDARYINAASIIPDASRKKFENLAHVIPHFFALALSRVMATNNSQKTPLRPARDDLHDDDVHDDERKTTTQTLFRKKKTKVLALLEAKRNAIERWERSLGRPATREDVVKDERMRTTCRENKNLLHDLEEEEEKKKKT